MLFKMVTSNEKHLGRIAGNAGRHAGMIAREITERYRDKLPRGQKIINLEQLQLFLRDDLLAARRKMTEVEKQHVEHLETDRLGREVRDVAIPRLRARLIGIQRLFDGAYGAGGSAKVFAENTVSIPTDAFALRRMAWFVHGRLTEEGLSLPASQLPGVEIEPRQLAAGLEEPLEQLHQALERLEQSQPATNASLEVKLRTLDEQTKQAGSSVRFLESLYRLARHEEIASRVRLSSHRSRQVADADADGDGGSGGDDGGNGNGDDGGGDAAPIVGAGPAAEGSGPEAGDAATDAQGSERAVTTETA